MPAKAGISCRIHQHSDGKGSKFCKRYNLTRLVYVEEAPTIVEALAREKAMKAWKRAWKVELIESVNPDWRDLTDEMIA